MTIPEMNYLPVKDGVGNHIRMSVDPSWVLQDGPRGTVLAEVLVGDLTGENGLSIVRKLRQGRHRTTGSENGGLTLLLSQLAGGMGKKNHRATGNWAM